MGTEIFVGLPTGCGVATYPPGATYGPRVLRDHEFVWMLEGDAEYRRGGPPPPGGGGRPPAAPAGGGGGAPPGETDSFRWDRQSRTRHGFFHFPVHSVPDGWPPPGEWPVVRLLPPDDLLRPLFRHLLTWGDREDAAQCRLTVAHILSVFVSGQTATGPEAPAVRPDAVVRACAFLRRALADDPARPLSLTQLADAACVTPEHLCRLFRASLGHAPMETVRRARLDYAAGLLARSNYSVGEISALCGFADPFHFSRAFKKTYGRSPSEVRAAVRAGSEPPSPRVLGRLAHPITGF